jgi:hypothetical protein
MQLSYAERCPGELEGVLGPFALSEAAPRGLIGEVVRPVQTCNLAESTKLAAFREVLVGGEGGIDKRPHSLKPRNLSHGAHPYEARRCFIIGEHRRRIEPKGHGYGYSGEIVFAAET